MINKYLKWLYEHDEVDESIFPMDSVHTGKPFKPNQIHETFDIDGDRIMLDFDQVVHKYSVGWIDDIIYDEPIKGAKESIDSFRSNGYEVILFTCRLSETTQGGSGEVLKQRKLIENWLKKYDIKVDGMTSEKLGASIYIDDRGFRFNGIWNKDIVQDVISKIKENK